MNDRLGRTVLAAAVVLAIVGVACGGGNSGPEPSPSSEGFVPIAVASATATSAATAAATPVPITTPTPTPFGTPDVQASAVANGCTTTPFATSGPPDVRAPYYPQWYGQGDLWFAPASIYAGYNLPQLATTSIWFQGITPAIVLANGDPTVTGQLQGAAATTLTTSPFPPNLVGAVRTQIPPHGVAVNLPQPGCWQLSITSGSETLNVTLWAVPIAQRPDVANLMAMRSYLTPYPPPASCPVTTWNGPADQGDPYTANYWINGQGMNVDAAIPVFFATQSGYLDVHQDLPNAPELTGQLTGENAAAVVRSSWVQHSSANNANGWRAELSFSNPGCWQLKITDGSATVELTLYVYPADCYHAVNEPKPMNCTPPA
jgi:hypothetical protein